MFMQNLGVTNKEHYGMLWYFFEGVCSHMNACKFSALDFSKEMWSVLVLPLFIYLEDLVNSWLHKDTYRN